MVSVEFDPEVNAMFIRFRKGKVAESEPLADNVIVDLDENGEVVGIEILLPKLAEEQKEFVAGVQLLFERVEDNQVS